MGSISVSINGRVNIDIVFHDQHTASSSIKVVEMESSEPHETGKVAIIKGVASTSHITIHHNNTGYIDAFGQEVSFSNVTRMALQASRQMSLEDNQANTVIFSCDNFIAYSQVDASNNVKLVPHYTSGTASYTVFLYGT